MTGIYPMRIWGKKWGNNMDLSDNLCKEENVEPNTKTSF